MTLRRAAQPQRFDRYGFLAIDPRAFFELFFEPTMRTNTRVGNVDVIEVSGPLVQRDEMWCDSYEAIRARVREACASDSQAIVMRFDSPGGDASGCFETARAIRADVAAANKLLVAYVDKACSAAYALASAASAILIGETCCAGSVGVLSSRPDQTAANMQRGLRMSFVVSGSRKLDGNPDYPVTDAELVATQQHVDDLALKFFDLVNEQRPQLSAARVAAFDGAVFYGDGAVEAGLADVVATFEQALAYASTGDTAMFLKAKSEYEDARAMLEKVAKGKDANAAAARRALATMAEAAPPGDDDKKEPDAPASADDDDDKPDEPASADDDDKEPDAAATVPEGKSESDDEPPADDTKKKSATSAPPAAAAASAELQLAARVHRLEAKAAQDAQARERRELIAKRPDFGPELKAALAKAPLATVRDMVKTLPKGAMPKREPITTVGASRGATQLDSLGGSVPSRLSGADANELDRAMGFSVPKLGSRREGSTMYFGHVRDEADSPNRSQP